MVKVKLQSCAKVFTLLLFPFPSLALDESSISSLGLDTTDQPWVNVMLQYRKAALNPLGE